MHTCHARRALSEAGDGVYLPKDQRQTTGYIQMSAAETAVSRLQKPAATTGGPTRTNIGALPAKIDSPSTSDRQGPVRSSWIDTWAAPSYSGLPEIV